ncbi:MAG TPA: tetratricopeptide repeat protein [Myxococcales bacterium]|nr:tetratricopeptide repeat protein [Myxococcales bacterium]
MPLDRKLTGFCKAACAAGLLAACATTASKPAPAADDLQELRSQLEAQSAMVAQQQRRIEELEVKMAALAARAKQAPPPAAAAPAPVPEIKDPPRPSLKTVKLGEGKGRRPPLRADHPAANPVDRAPQLPSGVELTEPDEDTLARLETDPEQTNEFNADHSWAVAVQEFNDGQRDKAEKDFLAFAKRYPRHSAADNALALAGLAREVRGDCKGALTLFESVPQRYPAGDAVPQAMLERGRCLRILGRKDEAKPVLQQLVQDHPDSPEAVQAQRLLLNP